MWVLLEWIKRGWSQRCHSSLLPAPQAVHQTWGTLTGISTLMIDWRLGTAEKWHLRRKECHKNFSRRGIKTHEKASEFLCKVRFVPNCHLVPFFSLGNYNFMSKCKNVVYIMTYATGYLNFSANAICQIAVSCHAKHRQHSWFTATVEIKSSFWNNSESIILFSDACVVFLWGL